MVWLCGINQHVGILMIITSHYIRLCCFQSYCRRAIHGLPCTQAKSGKDVKKTAEKKKKIIHPKSREAKRQNRQMERADHVGKKKLAHAKLAQLKRMDGHTNMASACTGGDC